MGSDADIISEVKRLLSSDASSCDTDAESKLEGVAFQISKFEPEARREAVQAVVKAIGQSPRAPDLLAWLLVYKVVDPLQVLQAIVYTGDSSLLRICGTDTFADDVIEHLKLQRQRGARPNSAVGESADPLFFDMLDANQFAEKAATFRPSPRSYESDSNLADTGHADSEHSSIKNKRLQMEQSAPRDQQTRAWLRDYEAQLRRVLKSSMSAEEAAYKISGIYRKNTEDSVVRNICKVCLEAKTYDRIFGAVSARLWRSNSSSWSTAWLNYFEAFIDGECEQLETEPLKLAGEFFAHMLSLDVMDWANAFACLDFDMRRSTPSTRIFILALLQELRKLVGIKAVENKLLSPDMEGSVRGVLDTDLAPGFWELAGFTDLAELARSRC